MNRSELCKSLIRQGSISTPRGFFRWLNHPDDVSQRIGFPIPHKSTTTPVVILDASFNPPTMAHLEMLRRIQTGKYPSIPSDIPLENFIALLSIQNADKALIQDVPLENRLEMLKILQDESFNHKSALPRFNVAVCDRPLFSDKIQLIQSEFESSELIFVIVGMDTCVRIFNPKYYTDIKASLSKLFEKSSLIVFNREGSATWDEFTRSNPFASSFSEKVIFVPFDDPFASMSSTIAREQFKSASDSSAVHKSIVPYILLNKFYQ